MSNRDIANRIKEKGYDVSDKVYISPFSWEIPRKQRNIIVCDCAEPKSISDLQQEGLNATACHKKPGCVEYRIKWLQHRRIVIDPKRTPNAYREFVNYSYATDKDGNFISRLPDKDNHTIDAAAYALDDQIYSYKTSA